MTQANSNIEAANSQNDVDQAKTTGENSIDQVTPTVNKKATARNEITAILNNKLQEIQATPDATDEEKQAADAEANTENGKAIKPFQQQLLTHKLMKLKQMQKQRLMR